jgi:ribonucleoside-triphosphate reductase
MFGEETSMKKCGMATEMYSRVTGYFRPVKNWNPGKQEEFRSRLMFGIPAERDAAIAPERAVEAPAEPCGCA